MATSLSRIIKYGLQSFWRNKWLSMTTVAVMILALSVFEGLILFSALTTNFLDILKDKIDISVDFKIPTPEDDMLKIKRSVESLSEVKNVDYISRDEALKVFLERHKNDETIGKAIGVLDSNPLPASLNIKAKDPREYKAIAAFLNNPGLKQSIDRVSFNENQVIINRLANIVETSQRGGIILTIVLSVIAILVTLTTIMLTIYSTRDEIGVMRLVGASNSFIRGPYIMQGILYGLCAAIVSTLILIPVVHVGAPYIQRLMPSIELQNYFYAHLLSLFLYQCVFGILLGTISSGIAVTRYLKI